MTRTSRLFLVVAACGLALVAIAFLALRETPVVDARRDVAPTSATPIAESSPQQHDAAVKARAEDARRKPANPPARWIVHVVAAEDGAPIQGAQIDLSGAPDWPRKATIDANGDVRIDASVVTLLPAVVKLRLRVGAPGRVREVLRAEVASGKTQEDTVRLRRAFGVDGLVHDAEGRPIAGARVTAQEKAADEDDAPASELADAVSGEDGRFRIEGLPTRTALDYHVVASRHGTRWISRRPHDSAPLDVRLDAAGVVRGVVRSPAGAPVSGACVAATRDRFSDGDPEFEFKSAPSGADGRFEIDALPLGDEWTLVASHEDFMESDHSRPIALTAACADSSCDLVLRPAGHLEVELVSAVKRDAWIAQLRWHDEVETTTCAVPGGTKRIVRKPGALAVDVCGEGLRHVSAEAEVAPGETRTLKIEVDEGESMSGIVLDDEGAPVGGAVVTVDPETPSEQHATSAADGTFAMKGVAFQVHKVRATAAGHATCDKTDIAESATWLRVEVPRDGEIALRLRVPDGAARPGQRRVKWIGRSPGDEDVAPWSDGAVSLALPPGMWNVAVEVDGYVTWRAEHAFFVAAGRRTDLGDAVLDPGLPLAGRVVDVAGSGVADADVFIDSDVVQTDSTGRFNAPHVASGYHDVGTNDSPDFLATAATRIRLDRDTQPIVLTVRRGAVLRVALRGAMTAATETQTHVEAVPADAPNGVVRVDGGSLFREAPDSYSARLPDGSRRVVVRCGDKTLATKEVVLRDGIDVSVDVDLAK